MCYTTGCECPGWAGEKCNQDVNECKSTTDICNSAGDPLVECVNTQGSYKCQCIDGYIFSEEAGKCHGKIYSNCFFYLKNRTRLEILHKLTVIPNVDS